MSIENFLNPLISAVAGLAGVFVGGWGNDRREREKRKTDFMNRQLAEFYGPLLGLRATIEAHSTLRVKLEHAQESSWSELVNLAQEDGGAAAIQTLRDGPIGQKYSGMIDEENRQFREVIFPWYQKMVDVFRENISLADPETRRHFSMLIEFVEVWDRFLKGQLPGQVTQALGHREKKLQPFYANIEQIHDRLQQSLAGRYG